MDPMLSKGDWNERGPTGTVDCRVCLTALDSTGTGYSTGMADLASNSLKPTLNHSEICDEFATCESLDRIDS